MKLRSVSLPGGGLLAWADPVWLQYILPTDSRKKRLVRALARLPLLGLVSSRFNGKLVFDGRIINLSDLLRQLADVIPDPIVSAIFVNSRRKPPRVYIWLTSTGVDYFVKIGTDEDLVAFRNEIDVLASQVSLLDIRVMRPLKLLVHNDLVMLVSEGMNKDLHASKRRLLPGEVLSHFSMQAGLPQGFFGGPVHCDLSSNNVFIVGNQVLIVDWEFAASSGPDFCDLIELGAAVVISDLQAPPDMERLKDVLLGPTGFSLPNTTIMKCLVFLAERGNRNAIKLLSTVGHNKGDT